MDTIGRGISQGTAGQWLQALAQLGGLGITAAGGSLGPVLVGASGIIENARERSAQRQLAGQLPEGTSWRKTADILANRLELSPSEYDRLHSAFQTEGASVLLPDVLAPVRERIPQPPAQAEVSGLERLAPEGQPPSGPAQVPIPQPPREVERPSTLPERFERVRRFSPEVEGILQREVLRLGGETEPRTRLAESVRQSWLDAGARPEAAALEYEQVLRTGQARYPTPEVDRKRSEREQFNREAAQMDLSKPSGRMRAWARARELGIPEEAEKYRIGSQTDIDREVQEERIRTNVIPAWRRVIDGWRGQGYPPSIVAALDAQMVDLEANPTTQNERAMGAAIRQAPQLAEREREFDVREKRIKAAKGDARVTQARQWAEELERTAGRLRTQADLTDDPIERQRMIREAATYWKRALRVLDEYQAEIEGGGGAPTPGGTGREYNIDPKSGATTPVPSGAR